MPFVFRNTRIIPFERDSYRFLMYINDVVFHSERFQSTLNHPQF